MSASRLVAALVGAGLVAGCAAPPPRPRELPAPPPDTSSPGAVKGTVKGKPLALKKAVFLYREKANDLALALTDVENPCAALSQGAMPKGATLVLASLKHNTKELRDAHFGGDKYPVRGATALPRDTKIATFFQLDDACGVKEKVRAVSGVVELTTPDVGTGGTASGTFDLQFEGGDALSGTFHASFCPVPEEERGGCR